MSMKHMPILPPENQSVRRGPLTRIELLQYAYQSTRAGRPITKSSMRRLLTAAEFREYDTLIAELFPKPNPRERAVLTAYSAQLREADRLHGRALNMSARGLKGMTRHRLLRQAQETYAAAHEQLVELLKLNPHLAYLFDRAVSEGCEREEMPRRWSSTSQSGESFKHHAAVQADFLRRCQLRANGALR